MIKNMVGLEAEFFLRNKSGTLLYPANHGFDTDDYIILGEFRGEPGTTREETLANFMKELYRIRLLAKKRGLTLDIADGWTELTVKKHAEIMRKMGRKEISTAKNIHGTDVLELTDAIIRRGKITGYYASIGLHVHFSSSEVSEVRLARDYVYVPVKLPVAIGDAGTTVLDLYRRDGHNPEEDVWAKARASRITVPVVQHIVKEMDTLLPNFSLEPTLKFRSPGFYEMKAHGGFEYRSLPFNESVLENLFDIVDYAYMLLEEL